MKSNLKSYRVQCEHCRQVKKATSSVMDQRQIVMYCKSCQASTIHRKKD